MTNSKALTTQDKRSKQIKNTNKIKNLMPDS